MGDDTPELTREELRSEARRLQERRVAKMAFGPGGPASPAKAIRERTHLTLKQALSGPDASDVDSARQAEVQRQRLRVEEMHRTFNILSAECIAKEEARALQGGLHEWQAKAEATCGSAGASTASRAACAPRRTSRLCWWAWRSTR